MNITFHCDYCGEILGLNRYEISPFTGKRCTSRAWCPKCYEMLQAWTTKEDGEYEAKFEEDTYDDDQMAV